TMVPTANQHRFATESPGGKVISQTSYAEYLISCAQPRGYWPFFDNTRLCGVMQRFARRGDAPLGPEIKGEIREMDDEKGRFPGLRRGAVGRRDGLRATQRPQRRSADRAQLQLVWLCRRGRHPQSLRAGRPQPDQAGLQRALGGAGPGLPGV